MLVNTEIKDRIAYVEMQNADHFNCLSEEMCEELIAALDEAYASECVGVVIKANLPRSLHTKLVSLNYFHAKRVLPVP